MIKGVICCALAAVWSLTSASARAEDFPSRYVTIVVPLATGGSTDTIARIMAEGMKAHLGQPVIVENSPGAGGSTGVIRVARSTPDGYTVQIGQWGTNVASGAVYDMPIDLLTDLEPVGLIVTQPSMIVGSATGGRADCGRIVHHAPGSFKLSGSAKLRVSAPGAAFVITKG